MLLPLPPPARSSLSEHSQGSAPSVVSSIGRREQGGDEAELEPDGPRTSRNPHSGSSRPNSTCFQATRHEAHWNAVTEPVTWKAGTRALSASQPAPQHAGLGHRGKTTQPLPRAHGPRNLLNSQEEEEVRSLEGKLRPVTQRGAEARQLAQGQVTCLPPPATPNFMDPWWGWFRDLLDKSLQPVSLRKLG